MRDTIDSAYWRLEVPSAPRQGRTICLPTVRPPGHQRVLRGAQALLDAGYDVHFVWLGGEPGETAYHERVRETRLRPARCLRDRLRAVPRIAELARRAEADLWVVHDLYLLPAARRWTRRTGRPIVYDVHEYHPEYYSHRLFPSGVTQQVTQRLVWGIERRLAADCAGINAVSAELAARFTGLPAVATPNFPQSSDFTHRPLTPDLLRKVVYAGGVNAYYGMETLVETARLLNRAAPDVELTIVPVFTSDQERHAFFAAIDRAGRPGNITVLDRIPPHRVAELLAGHGIGLSTLQDVGQAPLAIASKLYEYATVGLAVVASDLPATRRFLAGNAVAALVPPRRADRYAAAVLDLIGDAERVCAEVDRAAVRASGRLCWRTVCAPRIQALVKQALAAPAAARTDVPA
ncbi:glycosyltransferase family 4 protein [Micromonospora echinospora]|uniref:glycosyltransferase family 4 protein n=1 Tax=Micromonospora echinospora TaxID=1877 RepID=UPI0037897526